ncbi:MAG: hypothetical protein EHJ94_04295 [Deltaproteobacteria bacterium]|nr:MAG: hypothetical protein EHJ94_04295 [Deltaproteobacteria bacterium]
MDKNQKPVYEMIRDLLSDSKFENFLKEKNIAEVDRDLKFGHYQKGNDRAGFIVNLKEKNREDVTKIMVDLKQGKPTVHQVYDALYEIGKDCDIKIIIHTDNHNYADYGIPTADSYIVSRLICQLQDRGVDVRLYKYNEKTQNIVNNELYDILGTPKMGESMELPTKEQFMVETFWSVCVDSINECHYDPFHKYSWPFSNTTEGGYIGYDESIMNGEVEVYWDEKGVRYEIIQKNDSDEYMKKMLDHEMEALEKRYGKSAIRFVNVVGRLPRLYIQFSNRPFSWTYSATPKELTDFGSMIHEDVERICSQISEAVEKSMETELTKA